MHLSSESALTYFSCGGLAFCPHDHQKQRENRFEHTNTLAMATMLEQNCTASSRVSGKIFSLGGGAQFLLTCAKISMSPFSIWIKLGQKCTACNNSRNADLFRGWMGVKILWFHANIIRERALLQNTGCKRSLSAAWILTSSDPRMRTSNFVILLSVIHRTGPFLKPARQNML